MKTSEMLLELSKPIPDFECIEEEAVDESDEEDSGSVFDDEDFWEAIDLIETSRKQLSVLLKILGKHLAPARARLVQNHCDDLQQFIDFFVVKPASAEGDSK